MSDIEQPGEMTPFYFMPPVVCRCGYIPRPVGVMSKNWGGRLKFKCSNDKCVEYGHTYTVQFLEAKQC